MDYTRLLTSLRETFIHQDMFLFDKHTPEFTQDEGFLGDYFSQLAVEPRGKKPPRFYHSFSPFDVISNKAPHRAVVWENGELLLDIDFDSYVAMRTAAMNAVVLRGLGVDNLKDKRVLLFGAGKVATETIKILVSRLGLKSVSVITRSGDTTKLEQAMKGLDISIQAGSKACLEDYDVIICHTQSEVPVISKDDMANIKPGAILASFITSAKNGELADELYDTSLGNVIVDWDKTIANAPEMVRSQEAGVLDEQQVICMRELLDASRVIDPNKRYTIYRSTGTPIQNLAILKVLLDS